VATKVGLALATPTPKLRVYPYGTPKIEAPAAVVTLPETLNLHETYGQGVTSFRDLAVLVMVRDLVRREAFKTLANYVKPTGATSVKAALESYVPAAQAWDSLTVTSVDFDVVTMDGAPFLTALFHLDIIGNAT